MITKYYPKKYSMKINSRLSIPIICLFSTWGLAQKTDTLAEKMLVYQLPNGAWSKSLDKKTAINYTIPINEEIIKKAKERDDNYATIDNNATSKEINHLVKAYNNTQNKKYLIAAEKGIEYLLSMQYENGGFPQYYPNKAIYRKQVTYNDNAMINALTVLYNISEGKEGFGVINEKLKRKSKIAVEKGIKCILKTQYLQNNIPTIWADQYNEITLIPEKARAFEPASLASGESANIVRFLMEQKPTPEIVSAIKNAIKWFKESKIEGYSYGISKENGKTVRSLKEDKNSVIWARFYDLSNNKPIFGDRDGNTTYNYNEISEERKNGYGWYLDNPEKLINKEYPKWLLKNNITE